MKNKTMKLEMVWEEKRIRHKQNLIAERKPNMMPWGFVYFTSVNLWVKPVSNCIHRSFTARKIALGKQLWLQGLGAFSSVALSHIVLTGFVPFLVSDNMIQAFLFDILFFHMNWELLKGAGFSVLGAGFSLYLWARQQLSKLSLVVLPGCPSPENRTRCPSHSSSSH